MDKLTSLYSEKKQLQEALQDVYLQIDQEADVKKRAALAKQGQALRKDLERIRHEIQNLECHEVRV